MSQLKDPMKLLLKLAIFLLFLVASISLVIQIQKPNTIFPFFRCLTCDERVKDSDYLADYVLKTARQSTSGKKKLVTPINETKNEYPDGPLSTNISSIVFGIGGSAATWQNRKHYIESWWKKNVTRGFVYLDKGPENWPKSSPPYRVSEDWTRFKFFYSDSAVRIARIVVELFRLGLPNVRWFVMGDDDTVFFTENLVSVLSTYDHQEMYYIGANSESVEQNVMHSYGMAFGGGGFAISYPLAEALSKKMDGCLDRYYQLYGSDERIWACVSEIGVTLTLERGFHQNDLREDIYGLLAAHPVAPLVSLHHLDYVKPLFPDQTQAESLQKLIQASLVDPAQTLKQTFCYDLIRNWSVSISWGYTAQIYSSLVKAPDLITPQRTFKTWRSWGDGPFSFNTRPVIMDPCEQSVYFLEMVKEVAEGLTLSTYTINVIENQDKCNKDVMQVKRIAVFAPKMDHREWRKALRRHCCEISDGLNKKSLLVKIRRCKSGEAVTY